ncbi:MAG: hypothetical protein ABIU29_09845 [Chthoniobacterales bacterium]
MQSQAPIGREKGRKIDLVQAQLEIGAASEFDFAFEINPAGEIEKHGDYAGAWETIEKVYQNNPDDSKLNQMRASLTTKAADFVRTLRTAEQLETKDEIGSSLAWYLKAQKLYPAREFAQSGIDRLVKKVLPERE